MGRFGCRCSAYCSLFREYYSIDGQGKREDYIGKMRKVRFSDRIEWGERQYG